MTRALTLIIGAALCLHGSPARAASPTAAPPRDVSAEQVCQAQSALRWQRPAWSAQRCRDVAAALNVLPDPLTMLAVAVNESGMRADAIRRGGPDVYDLGLLGIRCRVENGKCTNGAARGYTVAQLLDPATNIRVGHVLATLKGPRWLYRWNGDPGYAARIAVLAAALAGESVTVVGTGPKWRRIEEMVRRIFAMGTKERRS